MSIRGEGCGGSDILAQVVADVFAQAGNGRLERERGRNLEAALQATFFRLYVQGYRMNGAHLG